MAVPAQPFRVLILNSPTLLDDFLSEAMAPHLDLLVIRERELAREPYPAPPDVVIVGRTVPEQEHTASALLHRWPKALVVTIAADRHGTTFHTFRPTKQSLGDLSPRQLVQAIRSTAGRGRTFYVQKPRPIPRPRRS